MRFLSLLLLAGLTFWHPGGGSAKAEDAAAAATAAPAEEGDDDRLLELAQKPWFGDLDEILKRGFIRVATANNPLYFSADGIDQRGLAVEVARELEKFIRKTYPEQVRQMNVVLMPMARDAILPSLVEGHADLAAANLTITPVCATFGSCLTPISTTRPSARWTGCCFPSRPTTPGRAI